MSFIELSSVLAIAFVILSDGNLPEATRARRMAFP